MLTILISDKNLTIEHLVVSQNVVEHLLIEVLGRSLKGNLHAAGLLWLQVDVPGVMINYL